MPARTLAPSARLSSCAARQWHASSAATVASGRSPSRSGCRSSASAMRECSAVSSPGSRSLWTASPTSAWRKPYMPSALITSTWCATASRAPSITSAGETPATASSSPCVIGRSSTAAARTTAWVAGASRSTRASSTSRSVSGSAQPSPSSAAASSSSVNSGLPSERPNSRSARSAGAGSCRMPSSCSASSPRSKRSSAIRSTPAGALQLGQQRAQRVAPVQLVGAVGDDEAERLLARAAHEERDEVARRAVGPVQVLDREQHRPGAARSRSSSASIASNRRPWRAAGSSSARVPVPPSSGSSSASALRVGRRQVAGPRALGGHPAGERPQRGDQRRVRDLRAAELEALAEQHARAALARAGLELAQQPRLADARLAADEDERRAAGRGAVERVAQQLQLGAAADERGGADAAGHGVHCRAGRRAARQRYGGAGGRGRVRAASASAEPGSGHRPRRDAAAW